MVVGGADVRELAAGSRRAAARSSHVRERDRLARRSPSASPRRSASAGRGGAHLLGGRLLVLAAPAPVLAPARCSRPRVYAPRADARRTAPPFTSLPAVSAQPEPAASAEILARGPWALAADPGALARGALRALRRADARPPTRRSASCRTAARRATTASRRASSTTARTRRDLDRAAAAALGAAAGRRRRLPEHRRAVRDARGRRPLAGGAPRAVGLLVGRALGARRGRRGRPRREPGRHARARAARRSGRSRPSASGARRCCACRTGW